MNVRFSQIIKSAGRPETYLPLLDPKKDRTLQKFVKAGRVMTVHQNTRGGKPDYGEVGFAPGASRQFLIFSKSLKRFARRRVVGIKYELLEDAPKPRERKKPPSKSQPKPKRRPKLKPPRRRKAPPRKPPLKSKIIAFPAPENEEQDDDALREIKKRVRKAMKALEAGRQVAAFNLLRRIVES